MLVFESCFGFWKTPIKETESKASTSMASQKENERYFLYFYIKKKMK